MTSEWFEFKRDLDTEAMLHVEGRKPKLVRVDWQWKAIKLK